MFKHVDDKLLKAVLILVTTHDKLLSARWLKDVILSVGFVPKSTKFILLSYRFLNTGYNKYL